MTEISKQCEERLWEIYRYGRKNKLHQFQSFPSFYQYHKKKYRSKKSSSKHHFDLTLQDWFELWDMDLLHNQNSRYKKKMVCRIIEPGAYTRENVYIGDPIDNSHDCIRNGNHRTAVFDPKIHTEGWTRHSATNFSIKAKK